MSEQWDEWLNCVRPAEWMNVVLLCCEWWTLFSLTVSSVGTLTCQIWSFKKVTRYRSHWTHFPFFISTSSEEVRGQTFMAAFLSQSWKGFGGFLEMRDVGNMKIHTLQQRGAPVSNSRAGSKSLRRSTLQPGCLHTVPGRCTHLFFYLQYEKIKNEWVKQLRVVAEPWSWFMLRMLLQRNEIKCMAKWLRTVAMLQHLITAHNLWNHLHWFQVFKKY